MKKKLIALAIAGAMTAPMAAMADVKITGGLQTQLIANGGSDATSKGLGMGAGGVLENNESGTWGAVNMSASHDLGGGLTALMHYGFNVRSTSDQASGNDGDHIGTRAAYVGLAGDFGAVLAGRMNHPYKTSTIGWDPFVATFMQARGNGGMGGPAWGALYGAETSKAVAYAGTFGGTKVVAAVVVDDANDTTNDKTVGNHGMAISVNVPVGPVEVAFAHANLSKMGRDGAAVDDDGNLLGVADKATATKVGVKYAAGDFSVAGQYEMMGEGLGDGNVMFVTGSYKMGANTISASIGMEDDDLRDSTYMAVGVSHALSPKARVFAGYRASDMLDGNYKTNAVGVGMRVSF